MRVGYLSSDYRDHPTSRLLMGLLRHHNRQRVEVFLYCSGWDDGSALRKAVLAQAEHFCSVGELSDAQAAQRIRDDGIDVLVELNGPTRGNRLGVLAHRAAPVQIDYLGWPGSVGGQLVDYVVGDAYTVPAGREQQYPEKVIRLNRVYQINDHAAMPRRVPPSRRALGLPEG
ncbi:MAG: glycosyl transferase family A, partial [Limnohabitans sp.]